MGAATQEVFELVLAREVAHAGGACGALVHLAWRSGQQADRLVQVYVDGELYDVTSDPAQRQMWLILDRSREHRIELLAVEEEVWAARPELLGSWRPAVRDAVEVAVLRDESLLVGTRVSVRLDGVEVDEGPMWPADEHRGGFGAIFGEGEFGFDAATGPGLGEGELGMGPLGMDGRAWRWRRVDLAAGTHTLALAAHDATGRRVAEMAGEQVMVERLPTAARRVVVDRAFVLSWQG